MHVMDDQNRIALIETKTVSDGVQVLSPIPVVRYQLGNHLGSASLELSDDGNIISYEEFHPYGTTAYHAGGSVVEGSVKRYRYTGMERDEESGLAYHGARYLAVWLGRWLNTDPIGISDGSNIYRYVGNNPERLVDSTGLARYCTAENPSGLDIFEKDTPTPSTPETSDNTNNQKGADAIAKGGILEPLSYLPLNQAVGMFVSHVASEAWDWASSEYIVPGKVPLIPRSLVKKIENSLENLSNDPTLQGELAVFADLAVIIEAPMTSTAPFKIPKVKGTPGAPNIPKVKGTPDALKTTIGGIPDDKIPAKSLVDRANELQEKIGSRRSTTVVTRTLVDNDSTVDLVTNSNKGRLAPKIRNDLEGSEIEVYNRTSKARPRKWPHDKPVPSEFRYHADTGGVTAAQELIEQLGEGTIVAAGISRDACNICGLVLREAGLVPVDPDSLDYWVRPGFEHLLLP